MILELKLLVVLLVALEKNALEEGPDHSASSTKVKY